MIRDNIVVVGGYGQVGRTICRELARSYPALIFWTRLRISTFR